ncbi:gas vesicle protein GvpN [Leptolyngbya sp. FACHB-36]|uniref:gas vesicle protein GvpN n=1 Tax=Leptolyngbya sp. FACHB-36 TaxID=2692808 RepID=UPI001681B041|nr:gas vesicle protein GvpN [Leptolyngbya sp. FACHB-36]MBD2019858.1 gas vesicle protein GvpN [Leptolyngbya sp. FACHB-36]
MTTVLRASPRRFVSTPAIDRVAVRALRYLQSGYSVHLRGPAGTGKTTLALHLADLLTRPIMLVYGDDEFKTSDLIGNQSGYTRKKVVDNYIHSVVKVEDELRQNWVDSRLTLACREGFTLVYDEFNRSRPEVNNVLLSALEEKLIVLPPSHNRSEYLRVNPQFRAIFTSNPEEYCGVHATQDALLDRLVTINIPEPDELTQQEIVVQKTEIDRSSALLIVRLVKAFRVKTQTDKASGLRACLMIAKVCHDHAVTVHSGNAEFRDLCCDVLLSRSTASLEDATKMLWNLLNEAIGLSEDLLSSSCEEAVDLAEPEPIADALDMLTIDALDTTTEEAATTPHERKILAYLVQFPNARPSEIEQALGLERIQLIDALRSLTEKGHVVQRDRVFTVKEEA